MANAKCAKPSLYGSYRENINFLTTFLPLSFSYIQKRSAMVNPDDLIEQAQQGNTWAFNKLADRWYPIIYNFAHKYFADEDKAMEITQQTFIVENALSQINPDQKVVVIMKEFEDMKFSEIAETLQISENTAKARMHYVLRSQTNFYF